MSTGLTPRHAPKRARAQRVSGRNTSPLSSKKSPPLLRRLRRCAAMCDRRPVTKGCRARVGISRQRVQQILSTRTFGAGESWADQTGSGERLRRTRRRTTCQRSEAFREPPDTNGSGTAEAGRTNPSAASAPPRDTPLRTSAQRHWGIARTVTQWRWARFQRSQPSRRPPPKNADGASTARSRGDPSGFPHRRRLRANVVSDCAEPPDTKGLGRRGTTASRPPAAHVAGDYLFLSSSSN